MCHEDVVVHHTHPLLSTSASGCPGAVVVSNSTYIQKRGRDGTKYSKFHPSNYLAHHLASISLAAVYTDAVHIEEGIDGLKQRALALAPCASE